MSEQEIIEELLKEEQSFTPEVTIADVLALKAQQKEQEIATQIAIAELTAMIGGLIT